MAPTTTTNTKRKASTEAGTKAKSPKISDKKCITCNEGGTSFPRLSNNCKGKHTNDVCKLCWTKYIDINVMDDGKEHIRCVQFENCGAFITYDDLKRIISGKVLSHYDCLVRRNHAVKNGERVCLAYMTNAVGQMVTCHAVHYHDLNRDGRLLTCTRCGIVECVSRAVPEHVGETCQERDARMEDEHGDEEQRTAVAFANGYDGLEEIGGSKTFAIKHKAPRACPCCGQMIERDGKCGHMSCPKCECQFCVICGAKYFGKGSLPELGNAAHQPFCTIFQRENEDRRYKRRVKAPRAKEDVKNEGGDGSDVDIKRECDA